MRRLLRYSMLTVSTAVVAGLLAGCATAPRPAELTVAEMALQDAKNARAEQLVTRRYDAAVRQLEQAEAAWRDDNDVAKSKHLARLAEAAARDAQHNAEAQAAEQALRQETERRRRSDLAVRDAEIALLRTTAALSEAQRQAEANARRAEEERRRVEAELARREAAEREAAARAQRSQAEQQRAAAELEALRADLEKSRAAAAAAAQAAAAEQQRVAEQRRLAEARAADLARLREERERLLQEQEKLKQDREALKQEQERLKEQQRKTQEELGSTLARLAEVREEARGLIVTLPGSIYFDFDRAEVKPALRERLREIATALAKVPERKLLVEGHTDSDGPSEYNMKLSELRAQAVRTVLVEGGIDPGRVETRGYGESRPRVPNTTADGKAQNRRVEIIVQASVSATN